MPTVLIIKGYKFKFYSNENDEPAHIHVIKGDGYSKYWLVPTIEEEYSYGFTIRERRDIKNMVNLNKDSLIKFWNENFK